MEPQPQTDPRERCRLCRAVLSELEEPPVHVACPGLSPAMGGLVFVACADCWRRQCDVDDDSSVRERAREE